jgi:hypothetical protein
MYSETRSWNEQNLASIQLNNELLNKYNSLRTNSIALRDEMKVRIQSAIKTNVDSLDNDW